MKTLYEINSNYKLGRRDFWINKARFFVSGPTFYTRQFFRNRLSFVTHVIMADQNEIK